MARRPAQTNSNGHPEQRLPPSRLSYLARKLHEASDEIGALIA